MTFLMLWIAMGMCTLVVCGLQETIAYLGMDSSGEFSEGGQTAYMALCLTLLVVIWPMVLLELVRGGQR